MGKIHWKLMSKEEYFKQLKDLINQSPYYQLLGMEVKKVGDGESRLQMAFKKELTHPYGTVHGGAIASLADSAVALALLSLVEPQHMVAAIEFKINYFAPVNQGRVIAHAKILHKESRTAVGDVKVTNEKGEVVAKVIATYSIKQAGDDQPVMPKT